MAKTINIFGTAIIRELLCLCGCHHHHHNTAKGFAISISNFPGQTIQLIGDSMFTLDNTQQITLTERPIDANNATAVITSIPVWTVSDPSLLTITPAADGVTAVYASVSGAVGVTTGSVSAVNSNGVTVTTSFDLTVTAPAPGLAVGFEVTGGTPVPRQ